MSRFVRKSVHSAFLLIWLWLFPTVVFGQRSEMVTCTHTQQNLRWIIEDVARQANVQFVYSDRLIDGKVSDCRIQEGSLEQVLEEIMPSAGIDYRIFPHRLVVLFAHKPQVETGDLNQEHLSKAFIQPRIDTEIEPHYPFEAQREGLEGSVDMCLFVNEEGDVTKTRVNTSSGYRILDDAAMAFAQKLRFNPAMRDGKPVAVWVSRTLNYKLVERQFLPSEYIDRIQNLNDRAALAMGEERSDCLEQILQTHEDLVLYLNAKPDLNYNRYIKRVVLPDVYERWKRVAGEKPLHFIVFHDFAIRFPNSMEAVKARQYLIDMIHDEMSSILNEKNSKKESDAQEDLFFLVLYRFLEKEYPETLDATLRTAVKKIERQ